MTAQQEMSSSVATDDLPDGKHLFRRRLVTEDDVVDLEHYRPEDLRPGSTIHACLAASAAQHPDKNAMVVIEPPDLLTPVRTLTYRRLVESVEEAACVFHEKARGAASVVAVMLAMRPEGLIATWGACAAGVAVPLNPHLELRSMVGLAVATGVTTLVTDRETLTAKCGGDIELLYREVPTLRSVVLVDDVDPAMDLAAAMSRFAGRGLNFQVDTDPRRDAIFMPTGGTTDAPKLVRMSQAEQLTVAWNVGALMGPEPDAVIGHGMPNFHCGGTISLGLRAMLYGQTLLTLSSIGFRSRAVIENFWAIVERYGMTSLLATPTTAQALLSAVGEPTAGHRLTDFYVGGSTVPMDLVRAFHQRFGVWLRENWGATEFHGTSTGHPNDGRQPVVGSVGRPLPHCRVRAVELDESGRYVRDCAPTERGVLVIGGSFVMQGYLDGTLNEEFFVQGMPQPGLWGNTGDIGSVDNDGYVWVFGRSKDLIIRGGHNIDPKQIEEALIMHPDVQIAAAIGRPDSKKGELPIAYVQLKPGRTADPQELIAFCRERVLESAATPVEIIVIDEMPLTPVGKMFKPALRRMLLEREVRRAVSENLGDVGCQVVVDESGPRRKVLVTLAPPAAADPTG